MAPDEPHDVAQPPLRQMSSDRCANIIGFVKCSQQIQRMKHDSTGTRQHTTQNVDSEGVFESYAVIGTLARLGKSPAA